MFVGDYVEEFVYIVWNLLLRVVNCDIVIGLFGIRKGDFVVVFLFEIIDFR